MEPKRRINEGPRPNHAVHRLSRRELLQAAVPIAALPLAFSASSFLAGCGGGGGSSSGSTATSVTVKGKLDTTVLKGTGLKAATGAQLDVAIAADGTFSIAAPMGAHPVFVMDSAGALAGLAVVPADASRAGTTVQVDAESTVLTLVMLTPGIGTSDVAQFQTRSAAIVASTEFAAAVSVLKSKLASGTLTQAIASSEFQTAISAVIQGAIATKARFIDPEGSEAMITITVDDLVNPKTPTQISNAGWRYVRVTKQNTNPVGGVASTPEVAAAMHGATGISLGTMLTHTYGSPGTLTDRNVDFTTYSKSDYVFQGFGFAPSEAIPAGVSHGATEAKLKTLIYYALFPIVDFLVGVAGDMEGVLKAVEELYADVKDFLTTLEDMDAASDIRAFLAVCINIVVSLLAWSVRNPADCWFVGHLGITEAAAAFLAKALALLGVALGAYNLGVLAVKLAQVPATNVISVNSDGNGSVVIS